MANDDQMSVELPADCARWVNEQIAAGAFSNPVEAVRFAINELKLAALRATLSASIERGGINTADDVRAFMATKLAAQRGVQEAVD